MLQCAIMRDFIRGNLAPNMSSAAKKILVTGSSGLIGSEAVEHFYRQGHQVIGIDNNMRRVFFGEQGDTTWNLERLRNKTRNFTHLDADIRDRAALEALFRAHKFDLIVHCAAQPSHDKARDIPILDFEVNALGTVNLLEATRLPYGPFAFRCRIARLSVVSGKGSAQWRNVFGIWLQGKTGARQHSQSRRSSRYRRVCGESESGRSL